MEGMKKKKKDACLLFIKHIWTDTHEHTNTLFYVYWGIKHRSVLFILIWNIVPRLQQSNNLHVLNQNTQISFLNPTWSELKYFERVKVIGFETNYVIKSSGCNSDLRAKLSLVLWFYMLDLIASQLINKCCIYGISKCSPICSVLNFSCHAVPVKATSFQLFDDVFLPTVPQSVPASFPCGFRVKSRVVMLSSDFLNVCPVQPPCPPYSLLKYRNLTRQLT